MSLHKVPRIRKRSLDKPHSIHKRTVRAECNEYDKRYQELFLNHNITSVHQNHWLVQRFRLTFHTPYVQNIVLKQVTKTWYCTFSLFLHNFSSHIRDAFGINKDQILKFSQN